MVASLNGEECDFVHETLGISWYNEHNLHSDKGDTACILILSVYFIIYLLRPKYIRQLFTNHAPEPSLVRDVAVTAK